MIIFTGMDNSGKTTLATQMSKLTATPLIKSLGPDHTKEEKDAWLWEQLEADKTQNLLYDRFLPFEEMVYGMVLRGNPLYSLNDPILQDLRRTRPTIYYTRPPHKYIFNFGDREQMKGVVERSTELLLAWDDLMWKLVNEGWKVIPYDYTKNI